MVNRQMMYSEDEESQEEGYINYKQKYRELKKHLRALIYENECFQDELRKAQRNFVSISRDKSYLLDRILKYEKPTGVSSDSDVTESSEEDDDGRASAQFGSSGVFGQRKKITKRKRSDIDISSNGAQNQPGEPNHSHAPAKIMKPISSKPLTMKLAVPAKKPKRPPPTRKPPLKKERQGGEISAPMNIQHPLMKSYHLDDMHVAGEEHVLTGGSEDYTDGGRRFDFSSEGQMTREDIERHLESRRFSPEIELNTTATVPAELFSQDPDQESDFEGSEICEFVQLEDDVTSADMVLE